MSNSIDNNNENHDLDGIEDLLSLVHVSRHSIDTTEENNFDSKFPFSSNKCKLKKMTNSGYTFKNRENINKIKEDFEELKNFKDIHSMSDNKLNISIDFKKYFCKSFYNQKFIEIKNEIIDDILNNKN